MNNKKVSIIIPARNEESFIKTTIEKYRSQDYPAEIVVVVNNSKDRTYEIAKNIADKVLNFQDDIGVSAARNEGAKVATGDVFVFSDADCYLEQGTVRKIADKVSSNTIGSPLGRGDSNTFKSKAFFFFRNLIHRLKIYQGVVGGIIICSKDVFVRAGGFDQNKRIAEFFDFIKRAKENGAEYKLFTDCYGVASMRRYEEQGYLKPVIFWIEWKILSIFKKEKKLTEEYFK